MKTAYPVVFTPLREGGYMAYVPDLELNTQGETLPEAIEMARDAIGLMGIDLEDSAQPLPAPSALKAVPAGPEDTVSLVDIDLSAYRRANERRTVRRNVSLPSWLNVEAEKAGINVSALLQAALKQALHIPE